MPSTAGRRGETRLPAVAAEVGFLPVVSERARRLSLALLFLVGAALSYVVVALPHQPQVDSAGELAVGGLGFPAAAAVWFGRDRLPRWTAHVFLQVGSVLVALGVYLGHGAPTSVAAAFFYVWIALYAFAFFDRPVAAVHVAGACIAYAGVLAAAGGRDRVGVWVLVAGTAWTAGIVVALLRQELLRLALTDPLTGLPNRHVLGLVLSHERARAQRHHTPLSVAVLDLDGLKQVNDRSGHAAGDEMLRAAAAGWSAALRRSDVLVRYGGDEFALVLPETGAPEAVQVVARLHDAAPAVPFSAGVAQLADREDPLALLGRADADLYQAKRARGPEDLGVR